MKMIWNVIDVVANVNLQCLQQKANVNCTIAQ
jgi:hypothetical protein